MNAPFRLAQSSPSDPDAGAPARLVKLTKPAAGQAITIDLTGSVNLDFADIAGENITLVHSGNQLIVLFDNKATITLDPFYGADGRILADLEVQLGPGHAVSGAEFATLFPVTTDQTILPAAGSRPTAGADFHDHSPIDALGGVAHPLDLLGALTFDTGSLDVLTRGTNTAPTAVAGVEDVPGSDPRGPGDTPGVNHPPVIHAPTGLAVTEGSAFAFSGAQAVTISDVDAGSGGLDLTVAVTHGSLHFLHVTDTTIVAGADLHVRDLPLGTLNQLLQDIVFTPDAHFTGQASIHIGVNDEGHTGSGGAQTDSETILIDVARDQPPVAADDKAMTDEDTALPVAAVNGVLANDIDPDPGETATLTIVTGATGDFTTQHGGAIHFNADGSYIYTPKTGFTGTDSVDYTVQDAHGVTDTGTLTITVNHVNHTPTATDDLFPAAPTPANTSPDMFIGGFPPFGASHVWLNDGTGVFDLQPQDYAPGHFTDYVNDVTLADVDNDGNLDAILAQTLLGVAVWHNAGDGTFTLVQTVAPSGAAGAADSSVQAGDLDGDGYVDLVTSGSGFNNPTVTAPNRVLLNNGDGTFRLAGTIGTSMGQSGIALGDFNEDGRLDAFVANGVDGGSVSSNPSVWLNDGSGHFSASTANGPDPLSVAGYSVATGDFNRDGHRDVVVGTESGGDQLWFGDGHGGFTLHQTIGDSFTRSFNVAVGDLNGDGYDDVVTASYQDQSGNFDLPEIYLNDTNGNLVASGIILSGIRANDISLSDIDGNGTLDAIVNTFTGQVYVFTNDGHAHFTLAHQLSTGTSLALALGNLDANVRPAQPIRADAPATLDVLANDSDPDGDTLTVSSLGASAIGATLSISADQHSVIYDAGHSAAAKALAAGGTLQDSFTYTVSDGHGGTDTATVQVTVTGVNDAPAAADDALANFPETDPVVITAATLLSNDSDPDAGDAISIVSVQGATNGAVSLSGDGQTITFTPTASYHGAAGFTYTISDNHGATSTATVSFDLIGVNHPPQITAVTNGSVTVIEDEATVPSSELIQNGGFETGIFDPNTFLLIGIPGWSVTGFPNLIAGAHSGNSALAITTLDVFGATLTASQSFATSFGQSYTVSFALRNAGNGNNSFDVSWEGQSLLSLSNVADQTGYTVYTFHVVANDSTTQLRFSFTNDNTWNLDDVSVKPDVTTPGAEHRSGTISFSDADLGDIHTVSYLPDAGGYYGTFTPVITDAATTDGVGEVSWNFSVNDADIQHLGANQAVSQIYHVTIDDNNGGTTGQDVSVTIQGVNDAPTGTVAITGVPSRNQILSASQTLADADGLGTLHYQWQRSDGTGGWIDVGLDLPTYKLGSNDIGHQIRVTASYIDGGGTAESVTSGTTATIGGANNPPDINFVLNIAAGPQMLVNGGFETGSLSGWTPGGNTSGTSVVNTQHRGGSWDLDISAFAGGTGSIAQTFATAAGVHYVIDFWLAIDPAATAQFTASWNGGNLVSVSTPGPGYAGQGYTEYNFDVIAAGPSSTLMLGFADQSFRMHLDDVSVRAASPAHSGLINFTDD